MTHSPRFPNFRRFWKPTVIIGAGGTAVVVWLEEIMFYAEEILALIFLPIMAGVIYLLNIFTFKSRMPKREDLTDSNDKGANQ